MKFCRLVHWSTGKVFQSVSLVQVTFITGFALPDSCGQTESFRLRPITHHFVHRHKLHSHWHTHTHQHQHMVQVTFNTGSHSACDQLPTTSYIDTNYTLTNTHTYTHTHTHTHQHKHMAQGLIGSSYLYHWICSYRHLRSVCFTKLLPTHWMDWHEMWHTMKVNFTNQSK